MSVIKRAEIEKKFREDYFVWLRTERDKNFEFMKNLRKKRG
jgi:hypothetical protein